MANELKLEGFKEFGDKLKSASTDVLDEIDAEVYDAAKMWEERAKIDCPKDNAGGGGIAGSIFGDRTGFMESEVVSPVAHSPYMEWGTGTRVSVPADLQGYAIQFKGKKSVIGVYPQPFFFIQKPIVEAHLINRIKEIVEDKLKQTLWGESGEKILNSSLEAFSGEKLSPYHIADEIMDSFRKQL